MLGCIGSNAEEIAGAKSDICVEEEDNDLVVKVSSTNNSMPQSQQHRGKCPFKQCVETLSPRHFITDEHLVSDERTPKETINTENSTSPSTERDTSDERSPDIVTTAIEPGSSPSTTDDKQPKTSVADDLRPQSPGIAGITTIDDIINGIANQKVGPKVNKAITGITTIDDILHALSGINGDKVNTTDKNSVDRNAEILQQLGILHLQDKITRPRQGKESEEHILREAGLALCQGDEDSLYDKEIAIAEEIEKNARKMKCMSPREMQILKTAGVKLDSHVINFTRDLDGPQMTLTTVGMTTVQPSESHLTMETLLPHTQGVSHTYAEKELLRRLRNGWASSGVHCPECSMPIIYKMEEGEGLMECVICGMLETNTNGEGQEVVQESFSNFSRMTPSGITINNHCENQKQITAPPGNQSVSSYVGTVNYQNQGQDLNQNQDFVSASGYSISSYIGTVANDAPPSNQSVSSYVGTVNYHNPGQDLSRIRDIAPPSNHSVSSYIGTITNVASPDNHSVSSYVGTVNYQNPGQYLSQNRDVAPPSNHSVSSYVGTVNYPNQGQDVCQKQNVPPPGDYSVSSYVGTIADVAPITNGSEKFVDDNYENEQDVCQKQNVASPSNNNVTTYVGAVANVHENIIRDSQNLAFEQCASCQDEVTSEDSTIFGHNHQAYRKPCENGILEKCKSDLALEADDELKKELGKMIFAGWTLCSLTCPNCNLPLITQGKGSPSICLRCG